MKIAMETIFFGERHLATKKLSQKEIQEIHQFIISK